MIVVTGASGFIGSHLVNSLSGDVVLCDFDNKKMLHPSVCAMFISYPKNEIECVFHLGGISSTTETNISRLIKNNILFSSDLLDVCIERDIPFVYASSASVYGLGDNGFSEDVSPTPLNYYAISKTSFDMYVSQKIKDNKDSKIFGLRYFNVYGKNEDHKRDMASPVHKFLKQSNEAREIRVFEGSENFVRDFIHVDDVVSMTIAAKDFNESGIYNVGTGIPRSFMDVANIISEVSQSPIVEIPFPDHLKGKYQKFTCSDNKKINLQGYTSSRISLEAGIKEVSSE